MEQKEQKEQENLEAIAKENLEAVAKTVANNIEIQSERLVTPPKEIDLILKESKQINIESASKEMLEWLIANVEGYIDNSVKNFKIDIIVDEKNKESLPEIKKLQDLYRAIPDDPDRDENLTQTQIDKAVECRQELDRVTKKIFNVMQDQKEFIEQLFKRMSFYYELRTIKNGKPIIQDMEGTVIINKFEYEAFSVPVKIMQGELNQKDIEEISSTETKEKKIIKTYIIPESFTCWIEIAYKPIQKPTNLF